MKQTVSRSLMFLGLLLAAFAGAPDHAAAYSINQTETGRSIRWSAPKVAFWIDPALEAMLPDGQTQHAIGMSLDAWRGFDGVPELEVLSGAPSSLGHHGNAPTNGIYLPAIWNHEPDKLAITIVTYEMASGRLLDADVIVNPDVTFDLLAELEDEQHEAVQSYDLGAVLTHEVGHVLGLGESEDDSMATMWPYADRGDTHQRTLSGDDEAGILDAYDGPPPLPAAACGPMTVAGHRAPPSWLTCLVLAMAVFVALRSASSSRRKRTLMAGGVALFALGGAGSIPRQATDCDHCAGAASSVIVTMADPVAHARVVHTFRDASLAHVGAARRLATRDENGLFMTDYEVVTAQGERVHLSLPGGERDGIGQRVGEGMLPDDGAELMVAQDGKRFAFHENGRVWGGSLGDGPAIQLQ